MRLTRRQLKILIENYLLTEAVHDTAAAAVGLTDPDKIELLRIASDKPHSLQKAELVWIAKYFLTPEGMLDNDITKIVEKIKKFKRSKSALDRNKLPTELNKYNDLTTLNQALARSQGTLDDSELAKESDLIYESENWRVYLPHTREAACRLGAGTPWCTARTTGENMFYSYTFGSEILLFHVIKKETSELSVDPNYNKMSISVLNYKDINWNSSSHTTVNFQNNPLTRDSFLEATGNEAPGILAAIEKYSNALEGKHPALDKVYDFIEDPDQYLIENRGKSRLAIIEFTFAMIMAFKKREGTNIAFDNPGLKENIRKSTLITVKDVNKLIGKNNFKDLSNLMRYKRLLNEAAGEEISEIEPEAYELLVKKSQEVGEALIDQAIFDFLNTFSKGKVVSWDEGSAVSEEFYGAMMSALSDEETGDFFGYLMDIPVLVSYLMGEYATEKITDVSGFRWDIGDGSDYYDGKMTIEEFSNYPEMFLLTGSPTLDSRESNYSYSSHPFEDTPSDGFPSRYLEDSNGAPGWMLLYR